MKIEQIGPREQISFTAANLADVLHKNRFRHEEFDDSTNVFHLHTSNYPAVVLREEVPKTPDDNYYTESDLTSLVEDWYEPELQKLDRLGIDAIPHHTFVVHPTDDAPPHLYTATRFVPAIRRVFDDYPHQAMSRISERQKQALKRIVVALDGYFQRAIESNIPAIDDITSGRQYAIDVYESSGDQPVLFDLDHRIIRDPERIKTTHHVLRQQARRQLQLVL